MPIKIQDEQHFHHEDFIAYQCVSPECIFEEDAPTLYMKTEDVQAELPAPVCPRCSEVMWGEHEIRTLDVCCELGIELPIQDY